MKLIMHVGIEKTGTSAIQGALFSNRERLKYQGIFYPSTGLWHDKSHHGLSFSIMNENSWGESKCYRELIAQLTEEITNSGCSTVILSSEILKEAYNFENFDYFMSEMDKIFDEIIVVMFIREQVAWLASVYNQYVKDPVVSCDLDFLSFSKANMSMCDFEIIADSWTNNSFVHDLLVLDYDEKKSDLVESFLQLIGIELSLPAHDNTPVNKSLDRPVIDLIRHFNSFEMDVEVRRSINRAIISKVKSECSYMDTDKGIYSKADCKYIIDKIQEVNLCLKNNFGIEFDFSKYDQVTSDGVMHDQDKYMLSNVILDLIGV